MEHHYSELTKVSEYPSDYVILDLETTGLNPLSDSIIQVAVLKCQNHQVVATYSTFVWTDFIPDRITQLTSITLKEVERAPRIEDVIPQLIEFIGAHIVVGHHVKFDLDFLSYQVKRLNIPESPLRYVDTVRLARQRMPQLPNYKLATLKQFLKINEVSHLADADCRVCHEVYQHCLNIEKAPILPKGKFRGTEERENEFRQALGYEQSGQINEAIKGYEALVSAHCLNPKPYDRLILLYRRQKHLEQELRILTVASQLFTGETKYVERLNRLKAQANFKT